MSANDTPHAITDEAIIPIKNYCEERNYKCRGCRYSIKYIVPDYKGYATCIFANCPCSWGMSEAIDRLEQELNKLDNGHEVADGEMTLTQYHTKRNELVIKLAKLKGEGN